MARKKLTKKAGGRGNGRKKKASGGRQRAPEQSLATTIRELHEKLQTLGVERSPGAIGKWTRRDDFRERFGRPSKENPVDARQVAEWAGKLAPNPADLPDREPDPPTEQQDNQPNSREELDGDPTDPYAPPSAERLCRLRERQPKEWAEVIRLMHVAERERIKNETTLGKLVARDRVDQENAAKLAAIKNAMRQTRRVIAPRVGELVSEQTRPLVSKKKARELERACGKLESEIDRVLEHAFETICNAYADGDDDAGG